MRCVAVDSGLASLGCVSLERIGQGWRVLEAHTFHTKPSDRGRRRIQIANIMGVCERCQPDVLVCEDTAQAWAGAQHGAGENLGSTYLSAAEVFRIEGAVEAIAYILRVPFGHVRPHVWHAHYSLTRASDDRIRTFARAMFGAPLARASIHACEAALIGACGATRVRSAA